MWWRYSFSVHVVSVWWQPSSSWYVWWKWMAGMKTDGLLSLSAANLVTCLPMETEDVRFNENSNDHRQMETSSLHPAFLSWHTCCLLDVYVFVLALIGCCLRPSPSYKGSCRQAAHVSGYKNSSWQSSGSDWWSMSIPRLEHCTCQEMIVGLSAGR